MNKRNDKGERHGQWKDYFHNGELNYKSNYYNGLHHGIYESYYRNGKIYYSCNHIMGEPKGLATRFNIHSDLMEKEFYL